LAPLDPFDDDGQLWKIDLSDRPYKGTIPQKNKTGNEKRSCCSAAHLFYPVSTSQNLEVKTAVKMGDYKRRN
jgi:hypothetical protein